MPKLPDGTCLMCAVGPLIPDDKYSLTMEGNTAAQVFIEAGMIETGDVGSEPIWGEYWKRVGYLINDLQKLHDYYPVHRWHEEAALIAKKHNLQFT